MNRVAFFGLNFSRASAFLVRDHHGGRRMLQDPGTRKLISEHVRRCEKEAAETVSVVLGDFRVDDGGEPVLRICFICKPGQETRVISVDGYEASSTESSPLTLH